MNQLNGLVVSAFAAEEVEKGWLKPIENRHFYVLWMVFCLSIVLIAGHSDAFGARDLLSATEEAKNRMSQMASYAVGAAILLGGGLYSLGLAAVGRYLLMSGAVGAATVIAGPSLIQFFANIFGVGVH